jgi:heme exporter protein B
MIRQILVLVRKDLVIERRSRASLNALIFFAALILVIVSFALGPNVHRLRATSGAILWIVFAFSAVLAFARSYQAESENRCFEGLLLAGMYPRAIYMGKLAGTSIVMFLVEAVVIITAAMLDDLNLVSVASLLTAITILGTVGIASVGVLYGRLTMSLRAREVMLPLLVLPVVIPAILASVKATTLVLASSTNGLGNWVELLIVFDVVFVTGGLLTYEALARE